MLRRTAILFALTLASIGCAESTGPAGSSATVLAVAPANGAIAVNVAASVVVTFSHPMMAGMEMNVVLHEGSVTGPLVVGNSAWSEDRRTLTFTPSAPLRSATSYVLHLAPTLTAAGGQGVDHGACAALGGQSVTTAMMGGGTMGGGMMGSGTMGSGMMGPGWEMAGGAYGMIFRFTTA